MNESTAVTALASDELPTFTDYRPLCLTALFAFLLGLASIVALVNPVLSIVPLGAIVMAVIALRQIAATEQGMSGRRLALSGLCLAALFLGWGMAGHLHHQAHINERAREFADEWLRIVSKGDLPRAYQLHVAREYRQDPHSAQERKNPKTGEPDSELQDFFKDPALAEFLAVGPKVRYRFEEVVKQTRDPLSDFVVLKYSFDGKNGTVPLWLTVRRTFSNSYRYADWEIYAVQHSPPGQ